MTPKEFIEEWTNADSSYYKKEFTNDVNSIASLMQLPGREEAQLHLEVIGKWIRSPKAFNYYMNGALSMYDWLAQHSEQPEANPQQPDNDEQVIADFADAIRDMQRMYRMGNITRAEHLRDELAKQMDDLMLLTSPPKHEKP